MQMRILLLVEKDKTDTKDCENIVTLRDAAKVDKDTLLICLEENYYYSTVFKGKVPVYCMNKYMTEVNITLGLILILDLSCIPNFYIDNTELQIANRIAIFLLNKNFVLYSRYFSGCNSNSKICRYISYTSGIQAIPLHKFRFAQDEIEVFAFMTGYIPCIFEEKGNYFLTTQSDVIIMKTNFTKLWVDNKDLNKNYHITYKDIDSMLLILDKINNITVLGPVIKYKNITVELIKAYIVKTIKLVIAKYPVQIAKYYISTATTILESMLIASRHTFCLLYRKNIIMNGRNTKINSYANFAYIDVYTFEHAVDTIFKSLKINPTFNWEQAMYILKNIICTNNSKNNICTIGSSGILVKLANLIRRRLIWKHGDSFSCLPRYLFKPISWHFDDKATVLPDNSRSFILRHILIQLERYLRPNKLDIIINGFMCYNLSDILKKIRWDNHIVKILSKQNKPISTIFTCTNIIFTKGKNNSIYDNYINWVKFIYNTLEKKHDLYPIFSSIENLDFIREEMPSLNNFLILSAKDIQRFLVTTSARKKLIK